MPSKQSDLSVPSVTPHPEYYLDDGDLYLFVNSETVFKINSWFFKRDSPKFRKVIEAASAIPDETKRPGSSSCPFKIDEVSPDQFAKFLDIYYDTYSDRSTFTVQEWVGILKIACAHEFPKIKHVATLNLEANEEVNVAERIKLYREYEISQDYLLPHILKIIKRDEYPSDAEEVILGDAVSTLISRARQNFLVATGGRKISSSINDQTAEKALRSVPDADTIIPLKISVDSPESKGGKGKVDRSEETDNLPNGRNGSTNGHGSRHAGGGRTK